MNDWMVLEIGLNSKTSLPCRWLQFRTDAVLGIRILFFLPLQGAYVSTCLREIRYIFTVRIKSESFCDKKSGDFNTSFALWDFCETVCIFEKKIQKYVEISFNNVRKKFVVEVKGLVFIIQEYKQTQKVLIKRCLYGDGANSMLWKIAT